MILKQDIINFFFKETKADKYHTFRVLFTVTFIIYLTERFLYAKEWLTNEGFHLTNTTKMWYHTYIMPTLEVWMIPVFAIIIVVSSFLFIFQIRPKLSVTFLLLVSIYIQSVDPISSFTLNKFYTTFFFLFLVSPEPNAKNKITAFPIRIVQLTVVVHYCTSGLCKVIHGDWLENPNILWTQVQGIYVTDFGAWMLRITPLAVWSMTGTVALLFELFAPILFYLKKSRKSTLIIGFGFHMIIALMMHQLIYFSLQMISFYILFLDENTFFSIKVFLRKKLTRSLNHY